MADYTPAFQPGDIITMTAGEAITGGQLVMLSVAADMTVLKATTDSPRPVGVAMADAANGAKVGVYIRGVVHRLVANGAITRGDTVSAGAVAGTVHTLVAAGTAWRADFGIALESAADLGFVRVMTY